LAQSIQPRGCRAALLAGRYTLCQIGTTVMARTPGAVALAICLAAPAYAQPAAVQSQTGTIAGVVIDDRTGQPIKGVSISVESQSIGAETDSNGRFSLSAPRG